ncbi:hypothetical protein EON82_04210 [bacterium]|nr:MAG: hypothetical protein EON82_04210 [bacterium]
MNWKAEILAVLRKEASTEWRTKTGLLTGGLFGLATVAALAFAFYNKNPNRLDETFLDHPMKDVCASLVWTILLFSSILSLPRAFLAEEENGTADLLRLMARPHAVFWGKMLFNLLQTWIGGLFLGFLFALSIGLEITHKGLFVACLLGGGAAIAGAVTLCGAIVAQAANRAALAGAVAVPLLLPLLQWGVTGMRAALGVERLGFGLNAAIGMGCYAVASLVLGPYLYAAVWKS